MMSMMQQQSSILSQQELHLLTSDAEQAQLSNFHVYSYQYEVELAGCTLHLADSIEQLLLMLRSGPLGIALILPDSIESAPSFELEQLVTLLMHRADIRVFWIGNPPRPETHLTIIDACHDACCLPNNIASWKAQIEQRFQRWRNNYSIAFITEDEQQKQQHEAHFNDMGLSNVSYFCATTALTHISNQQLLIIDLETPSLHLINILKHLTNHEWFPIILIYGRLPENVCHAAYTFIENNGFHILASLSDVPDQEQWQTLFSSLFSKVYLQHWVRSERTKVGAYKLYDLETQAITSYFCFPGMSKQQISQLPKTKDMRHIIHIDSLKGWFPDGGKRNVRMKLAAEMSCEPYNLDLCIKSPEKILRTSNLFSGLVMARLEKTKVYWHVDNENNLLADILKVYPISDVILSETLSHQLLNEPSPVLRNFIERAQHEQVNIVASLPPSVHTQQVLALYGIHSVLDE